MQSATRIFNENDRFDQGCGRRFSAADQGTGHPAMDIESPYREALTGILSFSSLAAAEGTIKRLEELRRKYRAESDNKGEAYCRDIARLGRRRAEMISRNAAVKAGKRKQKQEIATWFGIWLETPEIFENWLALRKTTTEYQDLLKNES